MWVYEGLTQYLGEVLAARSGIESPDEYRAALAAYAATLDYRPGRTWRDLHDTAVAAQILYDTSPEWDNWRRSVDYYQEGELLWLEADTIIRKLTKDKKSLNDFCARFEGLGGNTPPKVVPYTFDDVVAELQRCRALRLGGILQRAAHVEIAACAAGRNRKRRLQDRLHRQLPATSFRRGKRYRRRAGLVDARHHHQHDGHIDDVLVGSVSDKAGLGPGMQIVAVNGRQYTAALLSDAITAAKDTKDPIELILINTGYYKVVKIDYHDGLRFPHLERVHGHARPPRRYPQADDAAAAVEREELARRKQSRNLELQPAELGMFILPQLVGEMHHAALVELHLIARAPPSSIQAPQVAAARPLRHLQPNMLLLHVARCPGQPHVLREKHRLHVAHAHRLQPP